MNWINQYPKIAKIIDMFIRLIIIICFSYARDKYHEGSNILFFTNMLNGMLLIEILFIYRKYREKGGEA